jgi:hypothetical protein
MYNPASSRHPLNLIGLDDAPVSHTVPMLHSAMKHVRYRLDTAVWMPGKTGNVITLITGMEIIQQQEWV